MLLFRRCGNEDNRVERLSQPEVLSRGNARICFGTGFAKLHHTPASEVATSLPLSRSNVMKIENLEKLLENELKDLYSAESQLLKALPKMAKAAVSPGLKEAFTTHLEETEGQVERR